MFSEVKAYDYVLATKEYADTPQYTFKCANYELIADQPIADLASVDLLMCRSTGLVSPPCTPYVRSGGCLLASDAHAGTSPSALMLRCPHCISVALLGLSSRMG